MKMPRFRLKTLMLTVALVALGSWVWVQFAGSDPDREPWFLTLGFAFFGFGLMAFAVVALIGCAFLAFHAFRTVGGIGVRLAGWLSEAGPKP